VFAIGAAILSILVLFLARWLGSLLRRRRLDALLGTRSASLRHAAVDVGHKCDECGRDAAWFDWPNTFRRWLCDECAYKLTQIALGELEETDQPSADRFPDSDNAEDDDLPYFWNRRD